MMHPATPKISRASGWPRFAGGRVAPCAVRGCARGYGALYRPSGFVLSLPLRLLPLAVCLLDGAILFAVGLIPSEHSYAIALTALPCRHQSLYKMSKIARLAREVSLESLCLGFGSTDQFHRVPFCLIYDATTMFDAHVDFVA